MADRVWVTVDAKFNGVMVQLEQLRERLAAQGLYVVTAEEKKVLDTLDGDLGPSDSYLSDLTQSAGPLKWLARAVQAWRASR